MSSYQISEKQKQQIMAAFGMNGGSHLLSNSGSRSRTSSRTRTTRSQSRGQSRSRSQSRSSRPKSTSRSTLRSRSQPKKFGVSFAKSGFNQIMNATVRQASPILSSISSMKKKLLLAKANYFSKDNKDSKDVKSADNVALLEQQLDMLQKEFDMLKATFRAGLKDRPVHMRLSQKFVITTTVTSGVTNTVNMAGTSSPLLAVNNCTEWSTMLALFDEYKVVGGEAVFNYLNSVGTAGTSITDDSMAIIGYDGGAGNTSGSSTISMTQLSQHKILSVWSSGNAGLGLGPAPILHRFSWHVPKGTVVSGAANSLPGTEWVTCDNPQASGTLMFYHVGTVITAINTGAGDCYFNTEFRCRQ